MQYTHYFVYVEWKKKEAAYIETRIKEKNDWKIIQCMAYDVFKDCFYNVRELYA